MAASSSAIASCVVSLVRMGVLAQALRVLQAVGACALAVEGRESYLEQKGLEKCV